MTTAIDERLEEIVSRRQRELDQLIDLDRQLEELNSRIGSIVAPEAGITDEMSVPKGVLK